MSQASQRRWPPSSGVSGLHRRRLVQRLLYFYLSSVALDIPFLSNVSYVRPFAYTADDVFADLFPLFVVARTAKGLVPIRPTLACRQVFSFRPCEPDRNPSLAPWYAEFGCGFCKAPLEVR